MGLLADEETRKRRERATLMLARTRALSDLQQACAPAQRAMLEQAIADLDQRLTAISLSRNAKDPARTRIL